MANSYKARLKGVRRHRSYTVEELARALGKSTQTIRRWIKDGLPSLTEARPALIMGADVIDFKQGRKPAHQTCKPHECYCLRCRTPRPCAGGMADYVPLSATTGNLRGLCPVCDLMMHKRIKCDALPALKAILDVSFPQGVTTLKEALPLSLNDHFKAGA